MLRLHGIFCKPKCKKGVIKVHKYEKHIVCIVIFVVTVVPFTHAHHHQFHNKNSFKFSFFFIISILLCNSISLDYFFEFVQLNENPTIK